MVDMSYGFLAFEIETCGYTPLFFKLKFFSFWERAKARQRGLAHGGGSGSGREREMNLANRKTLRMQHSLRCSVRLQNIPFTVGAVSKSPVHKFILKSSLKVCGSRALGKCSQQTLQNNYLISSCFWNWGVSQYIYTMLQLPQEL